MRRTPVRPSLKAIARSPLPPRTTYLVRSTKPIRSRGRKRFPAGYDKAYRQYVTRLLCLLFGRPGHECGRSEPAHVHADATGVGDRGQLVPLCANAHRMGPKNWHDTGRHSFCAYWQLGTFADLERLALVIDREYEAGCPAFRETAP